MHVANGAIAILLGLWIQATVKGTGQHRRVGRVYVGFTLVVCATAIVGNAVFRFMPLFAVLTVLVLYQLLSGWHVVYTKAAGPNRLDALLSLGATVSALTLAALVLGSSKRESAPVVIYATLAALFALLAYDALRWLLSTAWHAASWRYEHIYKILASMYAMFSAAMGNSFPQAQPWSQLLPSALEIATIAWFCCQEYRNRAQRAAAVLAPLRRSA